MPMSILIFTHQCDNIVTDTLEKTTDVGWFNEWRNMRRKTLWTRRDRGERIIQTPTGVLRLLVQFQLIEGKHEVHRECQKQTWHLKYAQEQHFADTKHHTKAIRVVQRRSEWSNTHSRSSRRCSWETTDLTFPVGSPLGLPFLSFIHRSINSRTSSSTFSIDWQGFS